jgi:hypothetical protein
VRFGVGTREARFLQQRVPRTDQEELLMYIGPETIMPLASVLAAIGGVIMMFWRRVSSFTRNVFQRVTRIFAR